MAGIIELIAFHRPGQIEVEYGGLMVSGELFDHREPGGMNGLFFPQSHNPDLLFHF